MPPYDEEKSYGEVSYEPQSPPHDAAEIVIADRPKILQKLNNFLSRLGGEERGIERVLSHERTEQVFI